MKKILFLALVIASNFANAQEKTNPNITPFHSAQDAINGKTGIRFNTTNEWQAFVKQYPTWGARFDAYNNMPTRAFGAPISFVGIDEKEIALNFMNQALAAYQIPVNELELVAVNKDEKYTNVNFKQVHNGHEVLFSNITFRFNKQKQIVLFGIEAFANMNSTAAIITSTQATQFAEGSITTPIITSDVNTDYKIMALPNENGLSFVPVFEIMVHTQDTKEQDGQYLTYVNAIDGSIVYRQNKVVNIITNITGDTYVKNKWSTPVAKGLPYINVTVGSTNYYADALGNVNIPATSTINGTVSLQGKWCKVLNGATSTATILHPISMVGGDTLKFDTTAAATKYTKINAYYHTNVIHDFMKTKYPSFTGYDVVFPTRVDRTDGNCNAFYNGSSINFYEAGGAGGCNATATIADVIYHEYGHGINDKYYSSLGGNFQNGAMGEGYADVWALSIVRTPVIGPGFYASSASTGIRNYNPDSKVYPKDIVGEVHADGEIIAGAWWDTYVNWGDIDSASTLFAKTFNGLATGADGTEGIVFHKILIDALTYDDIDGNITNGTPHFFAIVNGFAKHGIFLNMDATIAHAPSTVVLPSIATPINANVTASYPVFITGVKMFYRLKPGLGIVSVLDSLLLTNTGGTNYAGNFPGKNAKDVFEYYLGLYESYYTSSFTITSPLNSLFGITTIQRNAPYYMVVGMNVIINEDFEGSALGWVLGATNDLATSGKWIIAKPFGTNTGGIMVQTDKDHTSGAGKCAVTGNNTSGSANSADVDGGRTTLFSPVLDLSKMKNPVFSYYRWFTNSQGSNARSDYWRVIISDNGGTTWTNIERTYEPDVSWRRIVGRVLDYKTNLSNIKFAFLATDSASTGSMLEAAIDDFQILDTEFPTAINNLNNLQIFVTPNPANTTVTINLPETKEIINVQLVDAMGRILMSKNNITNNNIEMNTSILASGIYFIKIIDNNIRTIGTEKLQIAR
jgi:hypothetical protein